MIISRKKYEEALHAAREEGRMNFVEYQTSKIKEKICECIDQIRKSEERITKKIDGKELIHKANILREVFFDIMPLRVEKIVRKEDIAQFPNVTELYKMQAQRELADQVAGMCDLFIEEDIKQGAYRITAEVRVAKRA